MASLAQQRKLSKKRIEVLKRMVAPPTKGKIASWGAVKREQFQRDVVARQMSLKEIAAKFDCSVGTVVKYREQHLLPAIAAATQNESIDLQGEAARSLRWLFNDSKEALQEVRGKGVNADGTPREIDPKKYGTYEAILGRSSEMVRILGELTGELRGKDARSMDAPMGRQVIKVISLPKTEGTPAFAMSIEQGGPDYSAVDLVDVEAEDAEQG